MTHAHLNSRTGIPLKYANRHGLITGATGTGKTVSLMKLAESFSLQGVPVFVSDVKGDIAALTRSCPAVVLDVFGETGQPLKSTVAAFGADLMARALELSDAQSGCLEIAFAAAREHGLPLATIADLRRVLVALGHEIDTRHYGNVSPASIGVVMRALLRLESQGGSQFFGDPQFDVARLLEWRGVTQPAGLVSILDSVRLINSPRVYAAFLLWLLSDLWDRLPEIGDTDQPRLVMFFDEAHLIFSDCPPALLRRIEQTVRLIRSKGVGVYFVSQSPNDIPQLIRDQLAHKIRHGRELAVGKAEFETMTATGQPAKPQLIQVELPSCPLGALKPNEAANLAPMMERPAAAENAAPWMRYTLATGWTSLCLIILVALVMGSVWIWESGHTVSALVVIAGLALTGFSGRRT